MLQTVAIHSVLACERLLQARITITLHLNSSRPPIVEMASIAMRASTAPVLRTGRIGLARPSLCPVTRVQRRAPQVQTRASDDDALTRGAVGEFTASTLFQLIGSAASVGGAGAAVAANSLGLVALIYAFANVSGAHLNPAVSFMLFLKGEIDMKKFLTYSGAQIAGCVLGALLCTFLIPGVAVGMGAAGPGAWAPAAGLGAAAIFGWESIMTAFLCLTVYGTAVCKPGFGVAAPIGIGLVIMAAALSCGSLSGCLINPARALGPALVFQNLGLGTILLYLSAHFAGAALSVALIKYLYGDASPMGKLKAAL
ncbi:MAG: aquaporin-like protein [Monoraphidium minutum]|nr:MAG: aquaporin-like protein [Monoraphidium minutum]